MTDETARDSIQERESMGLDDIRLTLTRDRNGVILWRGDPKMCFADRTYMNGGACMNLPEELFAGMNIPSRVTVRLAPWEGQTCKS